MKTTRLGHIFFGLIKTQLVPHSFGFGVPFQYTTSMSTWDRIFVEFGRGFGSVERSGVVQWVCKIRRVESGVYEIFSLFNSGDTE